MKRLVNVLLKELEDCPVSCVIIGATNHPELLDKAIWRRFDRNIYVPIPESEQRKELIIRGLGQKTLEIEDAVIQMLVDGTDSLSAADVCKMCEHIKRRTILYPEETVTMSALTEYCDYAGLKTKERKVKLCKALKNRGKKMTVKKISEITGIPSSSVDRYLKE